MSISRREIVARDNDQYEWYDTVEAAQFYGRDPRTVRRWCMDGTLVDAGCAVYRGPKDRSRQWLIGMPKNEQRSCLTPA